MLAHLTGLSWAYIGVRSWECWLVGRSLLGFVPLRLLVDAVCARVTESPRLADGVIRVLLVSATY